MSASNNTRRMYHQSIGGEERPFSLDCKEYVTRAMGWPVPEEFPTLPDNQGFAVKLRILRPIADDEESYGTYVTTILILTLEDLNLHEPHEIENLNRRLLRRTESEIRHDSYTFFLSSAVIATLNDMMLSSANGFKTMIVEDKNDTFGSMAVSGDLNKVFFKTDGGHATLEASLEELLYLIDRAKAQSEGVPIISRTTFMKQLTNVWTDEKAIKLLAWAAGFVGLMNTKKPGPGPLRCLFDLSAPMRPSEGVSQLSGPVEATLQTGASSAPHPIQIIVVGPSEAEASDTALLAPAETEGPSKAEKKREKKKRARARKQETKFQAKEAELTAKAAQPIEWY